MQLNILTYKNASLRIINGYKWIIRFIHVFIQGTSMCDESKPLALVLLDNFGGEQSHSFQHGRMICQSIKASGAKIIAPVPVSHSSMERIDAQLQGIKENFHIDVMVGHKNHTSIEYQKKWITNSFRTHYEKNMDEHTLKKLTHVVCFYPFSYISALYMSQAAAYMHVKFVCIMVERPRNEKVFKSLAEKFQMFYSIGDYVFSVCNAEFSDAAQFQHYKLTPTVADQYDKENPRKQPNPRNEELRVAIFLNSDIDETDERNFEKLHDFVRAYLNTNKDVLFKTIRYSPKLYVHGMKPSWQSRMFEHLDINAESLVILDEIRCQENLIHRIKASTVAVFPCRNASYDPLAIIAMYLGVPCIVQIDSGVGRMLRNTYTDGCDKVVINEDTSCLISTIEEMLVNLDASFETSSKLREFLRSRCGLNSLRLNLVNIL